MRINLCRGLNCKSSDLISAHIIPRGFARIARDDGHIISIEPGRKPSVTKYQHGSFDSSILCSACDGKLGRFDDYLVDFCRTFLKRQKPLSKSGFQVHDVDADLLRKGILAILWRASISQRPECKRITLGPFELKARDILFGTVQLEQFPDFQVMVQRYVTNEGSKIGFYTYPNRTKFDGINAYVFGLVGLRFIVKMDARPFPEVLDDFVVGRSPHLLGTLVDFDDTSEGRALRKKANPLFKYRTER